MNLIFWYILNYFYHFQPFLYYKNLVRINLGIRIKKSQCAESLNLFFHHYHHLSPAAGRPVRNNRISFIRLAGDINHLCTHWPPPQMMRWHQHRETIQSLLVPTGVDCSKIPSGLSILLCTELGDPWPGPPCISLPTERKSNNFPDYTDITKVMVDKNCVRYFMDIEMCQICGIWSLKTAAGYHVDCQFQRNDIIKYKKSEIIKRYENNLWVCIKQRPSELCVPCTSTTK